MVNRGIAMSFLDKWPAWLGVIQVENQARV
jgi:hypothetical protein